MDKNITLQGSTEEGNPTVLEQGISLASNNEPLSVNLVNMILQNGDFGVFDNNNGPEANERRDAVITLADCVIKDFTGKGVYTSSAKRLILKNCTFENCATGTDTGTTGDYAIDMNLIGTKGADVTITDCEFKGYLGGKAAVKITQRGGPSDEGAGDIPMDKGQATINSFSMSGCSFDTETSVDVRLGTEHKTPDQPDLENTTANFPVMISGNKTEINVLVAPTGESYVVPVGGIGYKNSTGEFTIIGGTTPEPEPEPEDPGATINGKGYETLTAAIEAAVDGDTVVMTKDYDQPISVVGKTITLDMAGHKIANTTPIWNVDTNVWSLISVGAGGDLTITGAGTVDALQDDAYGIDVRDSGMLTVEDTTVSGNVSAVYVLEGTALIEGGNYSLKQVNPDERFTLNCLDASYKDGTAIIEVTGGTFNKFDPADNLAEGAGTNFCAAGYTTEQQGDKYTVVKA